MAFKYFFKAIVLLVSLVTVDPFAIDNEVVGQPQVQCSEDSVSIAVRTRNRFAGNIFIKGKYQVPQCRQEYYSNTFNGASFTVKIGECGMQRIRQLQPHGMNYVLVFVVNFHNQFITKVDRAYNVRCFYAQIDKTVTSQLEVSMISTQDITDSTMLMPNCEYSIRSGTLNGPKVRYAQVGDRLVHRWECDNPNYGMLVKNCFVNDGQGSSVRVLDARGCPVFTPVIQGPPEYDTSLQLSYVEVWAYKFPDKNDLYFQCQIQICNKRDNECIGVTPPNCPNVLKPDYTGQAIQPVTDSLGRTLIPVFPVNPTASGFTPFQPFTQAPFGYTGGSFRPGGTFGQLIGPSGGQPYPYPQGGGGATIFQPGFPSGGGQVYPQPVSGGSNRQNWEIGQNLVQPGPGLPAGADLYGYQTQLPYGITNFPRARPYDAKDEPAEGLPPQRRSNAEIHEKTIDPALFNLLPNTTSPTPNATNSAKRKRSAEEPMVDSQNSTSRRPINRRNRLGTPGGTTEPPQGSEDLIDVTSETVFIIDLEDSENNKKRSEEAKKLPLTFRKENLDGEQLVCLNTVGMGLVLSCFVALILVIGSLLMYILVKGGKKPKSIDDGITVDSRSNCSPLEQLRLKIFH